MTYICYIHRASSETPQLEVLPDLTPVEAIDRAASLMAEKTDAVRAEVWDDERLIFTLPRAIMRSDHGPRPPFAT